MASSAPTRKAAHGKMNKHFPNIFLDLFCHLTNGLSFSLLVPQPPHQKNGENHRPRPQGV